MGIQPKELCGLTGLQYDQKARTFWGTLQGYPLFLTVIPRRDLFLYRLIVKTPDGFDEQNMKETLEKWRLEHPGISDLVFRDRALSAVVSITKKDAAASAAGNAAALTALAAELHLRPCCMACGREQNFQLYLLDGGGVTLCPQCKPFLEEKIEHAESEHSKIPPKRAGILIGALAGAVLTFLLTWFVLQYSSMALLTGYACSILCIFAAKKLGKKMTLPAIILCSVLCVLAGSAGTVLHQAGEIAAVHQAQAEDTEKIRDNSQQIIKQFEALTPEQQEAAKAEFGDKLDMETYRGNIQAAELILGNQTTESCLRNLPVLLKQPLYQNYRRRLIQHILGFLAAVLCGTLLTAPKMLAVDSGKHTLRELTA